ncbi:MAG: hypothetical protein K1X88_36325 [Nannocystaceae bacterium]|nr:hypothetical protein [Nannocystaceae bacterium]
MRSAAALVVLAIGCGGPPSHGGDGPGDSGETTGTSTGTGASDSTADSSAGPGFVASPDMGATVACDLYADDCAATHKCAPYASDGGLVADATRCVGLVPEPLPAGAACTVQDWPASGLDDCDRGLVCVVYDVQTLAGECVPLCVADPEQPDLVCIDPTATCVGGPDTLPRLCTSSCDPFGDDCPGGRHCYRINDHFTCLDDASGDGGAYGDTCFFTNQCDAGMLCADPPEFFECPSTEGCCTPFCDTRDPQASASCPGAPEHMCIRLFDPGAGPPLFDWVGACVLPTEGGP